MGVAVGAGVAVTVGGTDVPVDVAVGGSGVSVGGDGVVVGGSGVSVGKTAVKVGGTDVVVGSAFPQPTPSIKTISTVATML
jgi:hypothetical protein